MYTSQCVMGKEKAVPWMVVILSSSEQGPSSHQGQGKSGGHSLRSPPKPLGLGAARQRPPSQAGVCVHSLIHLPNNCLRRAPCPRALDFWIRKPRESLGSQEPQHQTLLGGQPPLKTFLNKDGFFIIIIKAGIAMC